MNAVSLPDATANVAAQDRLRPPPDAMKIRSFRRDDAAGVAHIFFTAVREIAALHYTAEQVNAWAPEPPSSERILSWGADGRLFLVATDPADAPIAFADLEADGHFDHFFCRPDLAGTGASAVLYSALEAEAASRGLTILYVEASEPARRFFERQGFAVECRRDFEIRGAPIHNFRMTKTIGR